MTSIIMLNISGENIHIFLVLGEKLYQSIFFPIKYDVSHGLSLDVLYWG